MNSSRLLKQSTSLDVFSLSQRLTQSSPRFGRNTNLEKFFNTNGLELPKEVSIAFPEGHPLSRLAGQIAHSFHTQRVPSRSTRQQNECLKDFLAPAVNGAFFNTLPSPQKSLFAAALAETVLYDTDRIETTLPPLKPMLDSLNTASTGTAAPLAPAYRQLALAPKFWQSYSNFHKLADNDKTAVGQSVIQHLLHYPAQTAERLEVLHALSQRLSKSHYFAGVTSDIGFKRLNLVLSSPIDDETWSETISHHLNTDTRRFRSFRGTRPLGLSDLNAMALGLLYSDGTVLTDTSADWAGQMVSHLLTVDDGVHASAAPATTVSTDRRPQTLPVHFVRLYTTKDQRPAEHLDRQEHLVRMIPFIPFLDVRSLLRPYLVHVDNKGFGQDLWGNESELMLMFKNPQVQQDDALAKDLNYAITAPKRFESEGVPNLPWSTLFLWSDVAALSHRFRSWKFDTAGGPNSLIVQYGAKPAPARDTDTLYGKGYYYQKGASLLELRRGYVLCSTPGAGTLIVPNKSINPDFNVRGILTEPAYYSDQVLTKTDLLTLKPDKDPRFTSILTPNLYKSGAFDLKLSHFLAEFNEFWTDQSQWKLDLIDPGITSSHRQSIFTRGGFRPLINALELVYRERKKDLYLSLHDPTMPPTNPIPFDKADPEGSEFLPVTNTLLEEMKLAANGEFIQTQDGSKTEFQKLIQRGISKKAIVIVEDRPRHSLKV